MIHHATLIRLDEPNDFTLENIDDTVEVIAFSFEKFGIDDSRELLERAYRRPAAGAESQIIIVRATFITEEAQQALLKLLEEPPHSTAFYFAIPPGVHILPTLLSRFSQERSQISLLEHNETFAHFLNMPVGERMQAIEAAMKDKNTTWQAAIKEGLVAYLSHRDAVLTSAVLTMLEFSARKLLTRGASNKFLFEHTALLLPSRS